MTDFIHPAVNLLHVLFEKVKLERKLEVYISSKIRMLRP